MVYLVFQDVVFTNWGCFICLPEHKEGGKESEDKDEPERSRERSKPARPDWNRLPSVLVMIRDAPNKKKRDFLEIFPKGGGLFNSQNFWSKFPKLLVQVKNGP